MASATHQDRVSGSGHDPDPRRQYPWAAAPGIVEDEIRHARRRWYGGAVFALFWQVLVVISLWSDGGTLEDHLVGSLALAIVYAAFLAAPEAMWRTSIVVRIFVLLSYAVLSGLLLIPLGPLAVWVWLLIAALTGFIAIRLWIAVVANLVICVAQITVSFVIGWDVALTTGILFAPLVTISVGASMIFFSRQRVAEERLGVAQDEITRLAVVEERARFSRDLHDVLGHSLTVVAMKSELAARLVDIDPARAKSEMEDVERLAREALQGLRQAVSGYREADLDAELVSAHTALEAAGVAPELPSDGRVVAPDMRSLFAWVLREGVTNVVRHSAATHARVTLTRTSITIEDDGTGAPETPRPSVDSLVGGNGLRGLRERADLAGARVIVGTSELGGYLLRVERDRA